jgi:hypothetical protein
MKGVMKWLVKDKTGRGHVLTWGITGGPEENHEIF